MNVLRLFGRHLRLVTLDEPTHPAGADAQRRRRANVGSSSVPAPVPPAGKPSTQPCPPAEKQAGTLIIFDSDWDDAA